MTTRQAVAKRTFDLVVSAVGILLTWWIAVLAVAIATIDTRHFGLFVQQRVGKDGRLFPLFKIRTMRDDPAHTTSVTTSHDPRITRIGSVFRRLKIDELPQLFNVFLGHMSFVGPRPDVPGFADLLEGDDRVVLTVRPGITGPATLKYRDEERLLQGVDDPEAYNRDVIFPDKVRINREYVEDYTFRADIDCLVQTFRSVVTDA
jgi:lipopolysaccharide/colanic/teichoic acid biosynthesis glycosyltransferase